MSENLDPSLKSEIPSKNERADPEEIIHRLDRLISLLKMKKQTEDKHEKEFKN